MDVTPYPSEWLRGVLELCVLRVLADGATYGYAIAAELAQAGLGEIKGGTLYPLLGRLEKNALEIGRASCRERVWSAGAEGTVGTEERARKRTKEREWRAKSPVGRA